MSETDVLPVPPELVPQVWKAVRRVCLSKIPNYNIERTHQRLLIGADQLWVAFGERPYGSQGKTCRRLYGVIITSLSKRPPQQRNAFKRSNPELMKSLTIHLAGEYGLRSWLDSAVERIGLYARQQGCHMLFLMARKNWHRWIKHPFYRGGWEVVAIGRDRPTKSTCKRFRERNKPGYFRLLVPVPADKWDRYYYGFMSTCYFKGEAA